jgi:DNA uptake protein ComE-like DNA-binding protein
LLLHHFIQPKNIIIADFSKTDLSFLKNRGAVSDSISISDKEALFVFNPNTVKKEQLIQLGFNEKTATTLLKYRSKGAIFKTNEDLKKVYGVTDDLYTKLEPYILIPSKDNPIEKNNTLLKTPVKKEIKIIELNTADSISLLPLPGIGGGYAKRILKYRSLLGGFVSKEQLKEVYGFSDSLYNMVQSYVTINTTMVTKINLNTENFKELNAHPYISYDETKAIFNYRRKNGLIKNHDQIKEILSEETIKKIEGYLGF